jgi:hypothetical protein
MPVSAWLARPALSLSQVPAGFFSRHLWEGSDSSDAIPLNHLLITYIYIYETRAEAYVRTRDE